MREGLGRVILHGFEYIAGLVGDGFQGSAYDVGGACAAGKAEEGAAGVAVPIGGAESGKGGNHVEAVGIGNLEGEGFALGGGCDNTEFVAEPLDGSASGEDTAFKGVGGLIVDLPGDCGKQVVVGGDRGCAGVLQKEAAGAIGIFGRAGCEAALTKEGGLLVAGDAVDGDGAAIKEGGGGVAEE